jgi:hypothetical protein
MPDDSPPRFWETMAYLLCIVVSIATIWDLLLSISGLCQPCTEKTVDYILLIPFFLILAYSGFRIFQRLFPEIRNHAGSAG